MTAVTEVPALTRHRLIRRLTSRATSEWSVTIAVVFLVLLLLATIFAPLVSPYDPNIGSLGGAYLAPSMQHLLGTDATGRDLLTRLLYGARYTLLGAVLIVGLATVIGVLLAVLGAWKQSSVDSIVVRVFDTIMVLPALLLALAATALFGAGMTAAGIALAIAYVPGIGRITRSAALQQAVQPYISALRLQGFRPARVILMHLLPNLAGIVLAQITVLFGYAIIDMASISYLGLGVQPPTADWGTMVAEGQSSIIRGYPGESLVAGVAIFLTVFAFNVIGDYLGKKFHV